MSTKTKVKEIWKSIKGYEELYQVSSLGRIKSLRRLGINGRYYGGKILKPQIRSGYNSVTLYKKNDAKSFVIHRLVAIAFVENVFNKTQVNHINEDKIDNNFENLEWVTAKENINHGTAISRRSKKRKNGLGSKPVLQFSLEMRFIRRWVSASECNRNGFYKSAVCSCARGEKKQYKGYIWKYE